LVAASGGAIAATAAAGASQIHLVYSMWPGEQPGYAKDVALFEKAHPNISVTIEVIPYANYEPKLTEEFTTGGGPDVFWVNTPWVPTWAKDGAFENLAPLVQKSHINMSAYNSYLVSLYSRGSDIYALPKELNTVAFVYNKSYFAKEHLTAPTNWSWSPSNPGSFLHFLQEATTDTSGNNALSAKFNAKSIAVYGADVANVDESGWGNFLAEDGSNVIAKPYATTVTVDTPAAVQTMSFINQLMYKYHVLVPGTELGGNAEANNGEDANLFAAGKIAMELSGSWNTESTVQQAKFSIGTLELPAGPEGVATVANGGADAVNPHSPNQQAAWELASYLDSVPSQKVLASSGTNWPSLTSVRSLFTAYWQSHSVNMNGYTSEGDLKANVGWPETYGMDQGLTDMATDMGPIWLGPQTTSQIKAELASAQTRADEDIVAAGG
jgi:multiple sugar transport system substrate-binding protein